MKLTLKVRAADAVFVDASGARRRRLCLADGLYVVGRGVLRKCNGAVAAALLQEIAREQREDA